MILKNYTLSFHGQGTKMAKVSLLLLQCNLEELYTFVSWSKYRMAKVSLFLHIMTIYYLEFRIFTNVISSVNDHSD